MISAFGHGVFEDVKFAESEAGVWGRLRVVGPVGGAEIERACGEDGAGTAGMGARGEDSAGTTRRAKESPRSLGPKHAAKERGLWDAKEIRWHVSYGTALVPDILTIAV